MELRENTKQAKVSHRQPGLWEEPENLILPLVHRTGYWLRPLSSTTSFWIGPRQYSTDLRKDTGLPRLK